MYQRTQHSAIDLFHTLSRRRLLKELHKYYVGEETFGQYLAKILIELRASREYIEHIVKSNWYNEK